MDADAEYTVEELDSLQKRLDDLSEWETIDGFWEAWSPRMNHKIITLIRMAKQRAISKENLGWRS